MHKRTKACAISPRVKMIVGERDNYRCIFCGAPGLPEAHVISRAQAGEGVPENIVTVCRKHHEMMDNSTNRAGMVEFARQYLRKFYPDLKDEDVTYDKWRWTKRGVEADKRV